MNIVEVVVEFERAPTTDEIEKLTEALAPNLPAETTFAPTGDNHPDIVFRDTQVTVILSSQTFTAEDAAPTARGEIDIEDSARNIVARALSDLGHTYDSARIIVAAAGSRD